MPQPSDSAESDCDHEGMSPRVNGSDERGVVRDGPSCARGPRARWASVRMLVETSPGPPCRGFPAGRMPDAVQRFRRDPHAESVPVRSRLSIYYQEPMLPHDRRVAELELAETVEQATGEDATWAPRPEEVEPDDEGWEYWDK